MNLNLLFSSTIMSDIEKIINEKEKELTIINNKLKNKLTIEEKETLLEKKNFIINKKMELLQMLNKFNNI